MFYKSLLKQRIFYYIPSSFNIFSKRELLGFSFKIVLSIKLLEGKRVLILKIVVKRLTIISKIPYKR